MKKLTFLSLIALIFASCANKPTVAIPSHTEIEHKVYSIPAKKQISIRAYLNEQANTGQVKELTDSLYLAAKYEKTEHGNPTHVFVYVYAKQGDYEQNSGSWISTRQMIDNEEKEIITKAAN